MMLRALSLPLLLLALPVQAGDLKRPTGMVCGDDGGRAADPADDEGATYVRNAGGAAPELCPGDGLRVPATRRQERGTIVFSATAPHGDAVVLGLRQKGGTCILTRREAGAQGRVWTATGRCTDQ